MNLEIQNLNFLLLFVAEENLLEILWHCFTVVCYRGVVTMATTAVALFYGYYV